MNGLRTNHLYEDHLPGGVGARYFRYISFASALNPSSALLPLMLVTNTMARSYF